jgi:selenide,water dikinase
MAEGSRVILHIDADAVPVQPGVLALAERDVVPGGTTANLDWVTPHVKFDASIGRPTQLVLADAQTNGGLFAAVAPDRLERVLRLLADRGVEGAHVGEVREAPEGGALEVA